MNLDDYLKEIRNWSIADKLSIDDEIVNKGWELNVSLNMSPTTSKQARYLLAVGKFQNALELYLKEHERFRDEDGKYWNHYWMRPNTVLNIKLILGDNYDLQALDILYYLKNHVTKWALHKPIELVEACDTFINKLKDKAHESLLLIISRASIEHFNGDERTGDSIFTEIWPFLHYLPENKKENIPLLGYSGFNILKAKLEPPFEENNFEEYLINLARNGENYLRDKYEVPKVGEGWISETQLFKLLKNHYSKYEVIQHAQPDWLRPQHLDIYFPEKNIGIEYQGKQHYEPVEHFGGKEAFKKTVERDKKKAKLCKNNQCKLIYVLPDYDLEKVLKSIDGHLKKLDKV